MNLLRMWWNFVQYWFWDYWENVGRLCPVYKNEDRTLIYLEKCF